MAPPKRTPAAHGRAARSTGCIDRRNRSRRRRHVPNWAGTGALALWLDYSRFAPYRETRYLRHLKKDKDKSKDIAERLTAPRFRGELIGDTAWCLRKVAL